MPGHKANRHLRSAANGGTLSEDGVQHKCNNQNIKPGTYWASFGMFALVALVMLIGGFALGLDPVIAGSDRPRRCIEPVALLALTAVAAWLWTTRAPGCNLAFDHSALPAWPIRLRDFYSSIRRDCDYRPIYSRRIPDVGRR